MAVKLQFRRDTAANWESNNTILSEGELGLDTTNERFKIGDGVNGWNALDNAQYTNKAETFSATTTILGFDSGTTEWTEETAGNWINDYIAIKTVSGLLTTDTPFIELDLSSATSTTSPGIQEDYAKIFRVEVSAIDTLTFYSKGEPTRNLTLQIKVVR